MANAREQFMLTTVDNPYNPFTHFDEWHAWDFTAGYHTSSYLARVVRTSDELSELDQDLAIEYGIQEILDHDALGVYMKVPQPQELRAA